MTCRELGTFAHLENSPDGRRKRPSVHREIQLGVNIWDCAGLPERKQIYLDFKRKRNKLPRERCPLRQLQSALERFSRIRKKKSVP
ncbi:hypothetical protein E2320_007204 [Naja naja]|nr:hypothetical protein E2320_007204 [Naja naja]